ncbi:3-oxo-tetronate kinase [Fictibacillus phosphorivorans]|uniref:3-oxo-tetronate kinase n=1 Tax=Fictibacillus phosphorivorans TaxID=1221500 RepID=UPI0020424A3A|nr:3-oxo-tetronate kinase [Fictibacillus phosphorivorans]MCM3718644.1 four-carbon acid sugar kinase family protein [Fictibacillus phosphorivorans]MCM3776267.1 four-carbon acid sugar kinase family protein [Fictibacillus phosphorivorans]
MRFGVIADDFTGGSDIASFFVKGGLSTVLYTEVPDSGAAPDAEVCVIALKTRTQNRNGAVSDSLEAIRWLKEQGAKQFYIKYCSTFDSTPEGNIGPICDAVMEELNVPYTILCPALPVNGRTVRNGCLFVNGVPLHESPMKNHPLTPMLDCDLARLMDPQSSFPSVKIPADASEEEVNEQLVKLEREHSHFYLIPDYEKEEDAEKLVEVFGGLRLLTGGSGLAYPLAKMYEEHGEAGRFGPSHSHAILLAGSCSEATRNQIKEFEQSGGRTYFMDPLKLLSGEESVERIWDMISQHSGESILIYSSETPEKVRDIQQQGKEEVAERLEKAMAELAERAVQASFHRIIVAGGETSGAVGKRLGYKGYHIGDSISPGVPVMIPIEDRRIRVVFKSGNFGKSDFFLQALSLT